MPKKRYHIIQKKVKSLLGKHKSDVTSYYDKPKLREYRKRLAKAHYLVEVESFLKQFRFTDDTLWALQLLGYFESATFYAQLLTLMECKKDEGIKPSEQALLCLDVLQSIDKALYQTFLSQCFLHYHSTQTPKSNIVINHQAIADHLAKMQGMTLVESFGEEEGKAFFNLYDDKENFLAGKRGKSIKKLRREVYKQMVKEFGKGKGIEV